MVPVFFDSSAAAVMHTANIHTSKMPHFDFILNSRSGHGTRSRLGGIAWHKQRPHTIAPQHEKRHHSGQRPVWNPKTIHPGHDQAECTMPSPANVTPDKKLQHRKQPTPDENNESDSRKHRPNNGKRRLIWFRSDVLRRNDHAYPDNYINERDARDECGYTGSYVMEDTQEPEMFLIQDFLLPLTVNCHPFLLIAQQYLFEQIQIIS